MSTATAEDDTEIVAAPAAKKGGKLKLIIGLVVVLAAAGGGGAFFMLKKPAAPVTSEEGEAASADGEAKADDPADGQGDGKATGAASDDFFPLSPQFVVNLNDEEAMRFLQVEVQIIARKAKAMDAVKLNDPVVRNRLMLLFSSQTYHGLLTRQGKEKLQLDALTEINKVLDEHKKPHIDGVVFTNLVMQ